PNPNMCPPLQLPGSLGSRLRFLLALRFHLVRLLFHPLVKRRLLEPPAVAQFESWNLLFAYVFVKRVRADSQILRSLANVHHFTRVGHNLIPYPQNQSRSPGFPEASETWERIPRSQTHSSEFRCAEHSET